MGYAEWDKIMESRTGSVSSRPGSSPSVRGQTFKSSPFCPRSSSKLTQSIIKDHMISHYKKVYSAKAAIDASVPKSLIHSVKYNDQIRQERLRKGGRPQSAQSLSQRNSRASCSSAQSRSSAHYNESPYLYSRSSMDSSLRLNTSFNAKDIVYPSNKVSLQNQHHHIRPASEMKYHSPEATLDRRQSACSLGVSGDQSCYKAFRDPVQKTYSGDLLMKHSQVFTQDKPFTPKTLRSDKSSYLSKYRYYQAPRRKTTEDCTGSRLMRQETYHGSTKTKEHTQELYESSQGFNTEREWSEDDFSGTCFSASREHSRANKSRDHELFYTSSRLSTEGGKSSTMNSVSKEEEELMYLEFISAVTEDILSRAHISNRVLEKVMNRHIDMNRHCLDEGKMRHLLEVLRQEFEEPANISNSTSEPKKKENGLFDSLLPHLASEREGAKTKDNENLLPCESRMQNRRLPDYCDPLSPYPPLCSSESTSTSLSKTIDIDGGGDNFKKGISSSWLSEHVPDNAALAQEDSHQNQTDTAALNKEIGNDSQECTSVSSDKAFHEDTAEVSYIGQSKELDDLGRSLSESLCVSSSTQHSNVKTTEQNTNTAATVSDDEF
ncbi:spermatogenesis-associated protein 7 homolog [Notolabrus celidotus]|uniref:spermatogenesis-associated protein 7 homolog n=1 Tax=Notolabrus celidotus TaxID=1203425 RepID=UPI00148FBC1D|nr:spermatogenesis-associated protein 7 homolog [Notolabrus celidotus]